MNYYQILFLFLYPNISSFGASAQADSFFGWSSNNLQLLQGYGFKLGDGSRTLLTLEHVDGWRYGENFIFIELINRNDISTAIYSEFYTRLSWSKITGRKPSLSFIKDTSLVTSLNMGNLPKHNPYKGYTEWQSKKATAGIEYHYWHDEKRSPIHDSDEFLTDV